MNKLPAGIAVLIAVALPVVAGFSVQEAAGWPWPVSKKNTNSSALKVFPVHNKTTNERITYKKYMAVESADVAALSEHQKENKI